jgi:hypothetical protein
MCPLCVVSAGMIVGGVVSGGGLTALVVKVLRKDKAKTTNDDSKAKEQ